jgi:cation transport ATPase
MGESKGYFSFADRLVLPVSALGLLSWLGLRLTNNAFSHVPLILVVALGGGILVVSLIRALVKGEAGSDFLAGLSIIGCTYLEEYLAASVVVLMLSGGQALERYALRRASATIAALAQRAPRTARRRTRTATTELIEVGQIQIGDILDVFPYEIFPVDGEVISGESAVDESYLTGEPYRLKKQAGARCLSGSINGESPLTIRAGRLASDSRYAQIMRVMEESSQHRPQMRRIGDRLGGLYSPLVLILAGLVFYFTADLQRAVTVLVVATPCPLLIAIPVAIIGAISLSAQRSIIIKDPLALERAPLCNRMIFDKTGTLTIGAPQLTEIRVLDSQFSQQQILQWAASLEQYSKHPLAVAVLAALTKSSASILAVEGVSERPGQGLVGRISGREVIITGRSD